MKLKLILGVGLILVGLYNAAWGGTGYLMAMGVIVTYLLLLGAAYHRKSKQQPPEFDRFTALLTGLSVLAFALATPCSLGSLLLIDIIAPEHAGFPILGLCAFFWGSCLLWLALDDRVGWTERVLRQKPQNKQAAE